MSKSNSMNKPIGSKSRKPNLDDINTNFPSISPSPDASGAENLMDDVSNLLIKWSSFDISTEVFTNKSDYEDQEYPRPTSGHGSSRTPFSFSTSLNDSATSYFNMNHDSKHSGAIFLPSWWPYTQMMMKETKRINDWVKKSKPLEVKEPATYDKWLKVNQSLVNEVPILQDLIQILYQDSTMIRFVNEEGLLEVIQEDKDHSLVEKRNSLKADQQKMALISKQKFIKTWELIYPKKENTLEPIYNPSGKYIVKLFWLGHWRRITVDDRIPLKSRTAMYSSKGESANNLSTLKQEIADESKGTLMIESPNENEYWQMILCKAILKLFTLTRCELKDAPRTLISSLSGSVCDTCSLERLYEIKEDEIGVVTLKNREMFYYQRSDQDTIILKPFTNTNEEKGFSHQNLKENLERVDIYRLVGDKKVFEYFYPGPRTSSGFIINFPKDVKEVVDMQVHFFGIAMDEKPSACVYYYDWKNENEDSIEISTQFQNDSKKLLANDLIKLVVRQCGGFMLQIYCNEFPISIKTEKEWLNYSDAKYKEFEEKTCTISANEWTPLFKFIFNPLQATRMKIFLFIEEWYDCLVNLKTIDNDNFQIVTASTAKELSTRLYKPNKNGYTLMADVVSNNQIQPTPFKIRYVYDQDVEISWSEEIITYSSIQTIEDFYYKNKKAVLFRYFITSDSIKNPVSVHVSTSDSQLKLCLKLFQDQKEKASVENNNGHVIMSALSLDPSLKYLLQASIVNPDSAFTSTIENSSTSVGASNTSIKGIAATPQATLKAEKKKTGGKENANAEGKSNIPAIFLTDLKFKLKLYSQGKVQSKPPTPSNPELDAALNLSSQPASNIVLTKDTAKEDYYAQLKKQWEDEEPGRLERAKESRENGIKHLQEMKLIEASSNIGKKEEENRLNRILKNLLNEPQLKMKYTNLDIDTIEQLKNRQKFYIQTLEVWFLSHATQHQQLPNNPSSVNVLDGANTATVDLVTPTDSPVQTNTLKEEYDNWVKSRTAYIQKLKSLEQQKQQQLLLQQQQQQLQQQQLLEQQQQQHHQQQVKDEEQEPKKKKPSKK